MERVALWTRERGEANRALCTREGRCEDANEACDESKRDRGVPPTHCAHRSGRSLDSGRTQCACLRGPRCAHSGRARASRSSRPVPLATPRPLPRASCRSNERGRRYATQRSDAAPIATPPRWSHCDHLSAAARSLSGVCCAPLLSLAPMRHTQGMIPPTLCGSTADPLNSGATVAGGARSHSGGH